MNKYKIAEEQFNRNLTYSIESEIDYNYLKKLQYIPPTKSYCVAALSGDL